MDLIRDCLDEQLKDRNQRPMGRVDGIILELSADAQPRVAFIEVGALTVADRFGPRVGKMFGALTQKLGISTDRYRIPWNKVKVGLNEVTVDVDAEKTPALDGEIWMRKKVIGRIPGA